MGTVASVSICIWVALAEISDVPQSDIGQNLDDFVSKSNNVKRDASPAKGMKNDKRRENLLRDTQDAIAKKSGKKKGPARKKRKNTGQRKRKGQKRKKKKKKKKKKKARKSKKGKERKRKGGKKTGKE